MTAFRTAGAIVATLLCVVTAQADDLRLIDAIKHQQPKAAAALLAAKADPRARQGDGATALHWAAHWNDLESARLLIRAGADVNAANDLGVTPLLIASASAGAAVGRALLDAGANPNLASMAGETPLMRAARTGNVELVNALVAHHADVNAKEPSRGQTPLMWAASRQHADIVEVLIKAGADVNARSRIRPTLINRGDPSREYKGEMLDLGGSTPLTFAARSGDLRAATLLVAAGADANYTAPDGTSPLIVAAHSGHGALAAFLLAKGANPNADAAGYTALHAAVLKDDVELVKQLLAHGANPNAPLVKGTPTRRNGQDFVLPTPLVGATPILLAAKFVEPEIVRVLAEGGADPKAVTPNGVTLLMMAVGIDTPEDSNRRGVLSLDGGTIESHSEVTATVDVVLALGPDVNQLDRAGNTALHVAAAMGYNDVIERLVARGAELSPMNRDGKTPLSLAVAPKAGTVYGVKDLLATAALLRKLGAAE